MLWFLLDVFLYLLAAYGAIVLVITVAGSVRQRMNCENTNARLVLMVKNGEEIIEGVIRSVFLEEFLRKIMVAEKLTVLDMGSTDKTMEILQNLKDEYIELEVLDEGRKESVFTYFEQPDN